MDIRALRVIGAGVLSSLLVCSANAEDGNAVGGSVRSAATKNPLDGVEVVVAQDTKISDKTRPDDAVYTLKVRTSLKEFDLTFTKNGYLTKHQERIANDAPQQKRPISEMEPEQRLKQLPPAKLRQLIEEARSMRSWGGEINSRMLINAARMNLEALNRSVEPVTKDLEQLKRSIEAELKEAERP
ncbi:MAG: hypothetical protein ACREBC_16160 [Pyrinomonadaceae bacterium]